MMQIYVNGELMNIPENSTVSDLLKQQGRGGSPCAVEVNRELVPKRKHDEHRLSDGDHIEIVTFVGGG
jgi:sulfur carrier protein